MRDHSIEKLAEHIKQQTKNHDTNYKEFTSKKPLEIPEETGGRDPISPMNRKLEIFESDYKNEDFLKEMFIKYGIRNVFGKEQRQFTIPNKVKQMPFSNNINMSE